MILKIFKVGCLVAKNNIQLRFSLVVLVSLLSLVLIGCGGDKAQETQVDLPVGGEVGNLAPDFDLKNIAGGTLQLSSLRGKVVIIDFWDTWCPPCRKALPHLEAISHEYSKDVVVVGVAFGRDGEAKVKEYVSQNNLTFPMVLADPEFKVTKDFGGVQSIPTTFMVDADGVIVKKWVGGHSREEYENAVKLILGSK